MVRNHHERYDGRGYPDGLKGENIPIGAMIVGIADAYDAMVTQRPYNKPMTFEQAVARLKEIAGTQHNPRVTEAFLRVLYRRKAEEEVGGVWRSVQQAEQPAASPAEEPASDGAAPTTAKPEVTH
jgi:HD-GYP domain-containing protein (c-di-GMP phosphodiesterase class II)